VQQQFVDRILRGEIELEEHGTNEFGLRFQKIAQRFHG
jgi:hypothetical protein